MKRIALCLVLTVCIFTVAIGSYIYISGVADRIAPAVADIAEKSGRGDFKGALVLARNTNDEWNKFIQKHVFITDKEHIMEITITLARIESLADEENDDIVTECAVARKLLEVYREKQEAGLMNIL